MTELAEQSTSAWRKLRLTLEMIKFEHSVFALPFALTGALLAVRDGRWAVEGLWSKLGWILVAMVGARSAAMAFNRLVDHEIDARNPRTRMRQLPAGQLSRGFAWTFTLASVGLFLVAAWALGPLCLKLAPVALAVLLGYSYTKRFTPLAHIVLGFALGIAPAAAWIAIQGSLKIEILWLTAAVMFWTAGFDIIYSCMDHDFDRQAGLYSIPARLGLRRALWVSRLLHVAMLACLVALAVAFGLTWIAWAGVAIVAALIAYEHSLVRHDDLSRVDAAFFTVNGFVGVLFFVFWTLDMVWRDIVRTGI